MKNIFRTLVILTLAVFVSTACTDSTEYDNIDPRPIGDLLYPTNGSAVELYKYSTSKTNFEWKKSEGTQMYTVVFYAADKKTELGTFLADYNGERNSLQLAHTDLSVIAEKGGIAAGESGDIYWNVINAAGSQSVISPTQNKLTLKRFKAALEKPYRLFITGTGSEGGIDVTQAMQLKSDGDKFEIYTRLNGDVSFVNRNEEGNKMNIGFNEQGEFTYGDEAYGTVAEGVYRVTVNFLMSEVKFEKINSLKMMRANNVLLVDMTYGGKGVWNSNQQIALRWADGDDRYRFMADVDGHQEVWGSTRTDRDADQPSTILGSDAYYNLNVDASTGTTGDSYKRCYKFWSRVDGEPASVSVHMLPERFYHEFTLTFPLDVVPVVPALTTPADNAKVLLSTTEGASTEFKWEAPADAPQLRLTSYKVVFAKDAAMSQVAGSIAGDWNKNTTVRISHKDLDGIAAAAGIPTGKSGDLFWTIQSTVEGTSAMSSAVRGITLRRFISQPTAAFITGSGSEFAAEYGKMHVITDDGKDKGKFEIYVRMINGAKYDLTTDDDPDSDNYSKYAVKTLKTGGEIAEDANADNTFTRENGVYRLIVDFNADTIGLYKVESMRFVSLVVRDQQIALDYLGNGHWGKDNVIPVFKGGWDDDRFNYFAKYDGEETKLGSNERSQGEVAEQLPEGDPKYWLYLTGEKSDWDFYLHCIKSYRANTDKKAHLHVYMNGKGNVAHAYTHIEYLSK